MGSEKKQGIEQKLYETRLKSRERALEFMGVDVGALREMEQSIDKDYGRLADQVRKGLAEKGTRVAERHAISLKRAEAALQAEIGGILDIGDIQIAKLWCHCLPFFNAAHVGTGSDPAVISPPAGGTGSASVTWGTDCEGHPMVDVSGGGAGTTNSAELTSHCRFAFTPATDRIYCIRPYVYMNGHYLAWSWGSCAGGDQGSAQVSVTLEVQIDQLGVPVKTIDHTVFDVSVAGGGDSQSGFAYDSFADGGASTSAWLEGGHEVIVWVKCTAFAEVVNYGRAWVDMQTSPQFYFRVTDLRWGPVWCHLHPWEIART